MRAPVSGGPSPPVLEARNFVDFRCAMPPATLCALSEKSADNKLLTATAFDPIKGRGRVLMTIPADPSYPYDNAALSPDGIHFAYLKLREPHGHIQLLTLEGALNARSRLKNGPGS
jgi:hypothetical protein